MRSSSFSKLRVDPPLYLLLDFVSPVSCPTGRSFNVPIQTHLASRPLGPLFPFYTPFLRWTLFAHPPFEATWKLRFPFTPLHPDGGVYVLEKGRHNSIHLFFALLSIMGMSSSLSRGKFSRAGFDLSPLIVHASLPSRPMKLTLLASTLTYHWNPFSPILTILFFGNTLPLPLSPSHRFVSLYLFYFTTLLLGGGTPPPLPTLILPVDMVQVVPDASRIN